jgi:WD40 repeat protein
VTDINNQTFRTGSFDSTIHLLDSRSRHTAMSIVLTNDVVSCLTPSAAGDMVWSASLSGILTEWDCHTREPRRRVNLSSMAQSLVSINAVIAIDVACLWCGRSPG